MKVLVYNVYYYPSQNYGGPATSMRNIVAYCGDKIEFYIVALNHDLGETNRYEGINDGWNSVENAKVLYLNDSEYKKERLIKLMDEINPSVIWLSGIWSLLTPPLTKAAIKKNIGVLMSPRGALNKAAMHMKGYKKFPFLLLERLCKVYKNTYFHVTGEGEYIGTKKYLKVPDKHIYNIKNLPSFAPPLQNLAKEKDVLQVAYVSRINPTKNLLYALKCIISLQSKVVFDIYGPAEDKNYWEECKKAISKKPTNVKINYYGAIKADDVSKVYQNHHCALLPTLTENYGHAIVEAMLNGCPPLIPKGTTPWDIIDGKAGFVIDLDSPSEFVDRLEMIAGFNQEEFNNIRIRTRLSIEKELMTKEISDKYISMLMKIGGVER